MPPIKKKAKGRSLKRLSPLYRGSLSQRKVSLIEKTAKGPKGAVLPPIEETAKGPKGAAAN